MTLTGQERHRFQFFIPLFGDLDGLSLLVLSLGGPSHFVGVAHDLREVARIQRVHHVKEILPGRALALGELIGEVPQEVLVLLEQRPQISHGQLIVVGHLHRVDHLLLQQRLLFREDLPEEVFVHLGLRRQVVLYCNGVRMREEAAPTMLVEILIEILFALQLPLDFLCLYKSEAAFLVARINLEPGVVLFHRS